jgi:hypothetical protein
LGNAAGIRMRGDSCRNYRFAQEEWQPYNSQQTSRVTPALVTIPPSRRGQTIMTGLRAVFQAAPSCYAYRQLDPTDSKLSIDTFVPYTFIHSGPIIRPS